VNCSYLGGKIGNASLVLERLLGRVDDACRTPTQAHLSIVGAPSRAELALFVRGTMVYRMLVDSGDPWPCACCLPA
jgi:hypothetical protein